MTHEEMALEELMVAFAESYLLGDLGEMEEVTEELRNRLKKNLDK